MRITEEMLVLAAKEITEEELINFTAQLELVRFTRSKVLEAMVVSLLPEYKSIGTIGTMAEQLSIAILVGIKLGKKEATIELSQVR